MYKQVKKDKNKKNIVCPHCKYQFHVCYKKGTALLILIAVLFLIGLNLLLLAMIPFMDTINIIGLFFVTAIGICITYFLIPYTVRFKK